MSHRRIFLLQGQSHRRIFKILLEDRRHLSYIIISGYLESKESKTWYIHCNTVLSYVDYFFKHLWVQSLVIGFEIVILEDGRKRHSNYGLYGTK